MKTETQIIAIGLDVLALNIPDGANCKLIKAASDKLIELESENEALKYLDDEASHGASELTNKIGEINALANGLWDCRTCWTIQISNGSGKSSSYLVAWYADPVQEAKSFETQT
jgi:hypothetical protein